MLDALEELDRELAQRGGTMHVAALPDGAAEVAGRVPWFAGLERQGRVHATVDIGVGTAGGVQGDVHPDDARDDR